MRPELKPWSTREDWLRIENDLELARRELAAAPAGIFRQPRYDRMASIQRRASDFINTWLSSAFGLARVDSPRMVLSLDVDGVLEDEVLGFSSTDLIGAAALRLLQLGGVAVLLNSARSIDEVRARCDSFQLLGAVSAFGGAVWDAVFEREEVLISPSAKQQLATLRSALRSDPTAVIDSSYDVSLRVSRIVEGEPAPIVGAAARLLLERLGLSELTFWVAPGHTDFVDRGVDKATGITRLRALLSLRSQPLAAMGDAACDVPMLRLAHLAFVPAATLPTYTPLRSQRLVRTHKLGAASVWEAACRLVPDTAIQDEVLSHSRAVQLPVWLPSELRHKPVNTPGVFGRIAAAISRKPRGGPA